MILSTVWFGLALCHVAQSDGGDLVFLTLSEMADKINVNLVSKERNGPLALLSAGGEQSPMVESHQLDGYSYYVGQLDAPKRAQETIGYQIGDGTKGKKNGTIALPPNGVATNLTVCVFGDWRIEVNISKFVEQNRCQLDLFIGAMQWSQSLNGSQRLLTFNTRSTFLTWWRNPDNRLLANVPMIAGGMDRGVKETSFFNCTEVNGVAFIQTTVELYSTAQLSEDNEQFSHLEQYFRETMLNELECKLQELHRRPKRPWIIVYLTHVDSLSSSVVMNLKDNDRFFEILNRYKIDLILSCTIEGMESDLKARQRSHPDETVPSYIATSFSNLPGNRALVLQIGDTQAAHYHADIGGNKYGQSTFSKSTQSADVCVAGEVESVSGSRSSNNKRLSF